MAGLQGNLKLLTVSHDISPGQSCSRSNCWPGKDEGDRLPSSMTPEGNKQPNPEPGTPYRQICPYFSHQSGIKTTKQNKTNEKKDQNSN